MPVHVALFLPLPTHADTEFPACRLANVFLARFCPTHTRNPIWPTTMPRVLHFLSAVLTMESFVEHVFARFSEIDAPPRLNVPSNSDIFAGFSSPKAGDIVLKGFFNKQAWPPELASKLHVDRQGRFNYQTAIIPLGSDRAIVPWFSTTWRRKTRPRTGKRKDEPDVYFYNIRQFVNRSGIRALDGVAIAPAHSNRRLQTTSSGDAARFRTDGGQSQNWHAWETHFGEENWFFIQKQHYLGDTKTEVKRRMLVAELFDIEQPNPTRLSRINQLADPAAPILTISRNGNLVTDLDYELVYSTEPDAKHHFNAYKIFQPDVASADREYPMIAITHAEGFQTVDRSTFVRGKELGGSRRFLRRQGMVSLAYMDKNHFIVITPISTSSYSLESSRVPNWRLVVTCGAAGDQRPGYDPTTHKGPGCSGKGEVATEINPFILHRLSRKGLRTILTPVQPDDNEVRAPRVMDTVPLGTTSDLGHRNNELVKQVPVKKAPAKQVPVKQLALVR